jgi:proliferating cell nuclear antigen
MTFSAIIDEDVLTDWLDPATALVSEAKIHATDGGLELAAVDAANVAMVELELDASACASYEASGEVLGVNLERLTEVVSMADSGDMVELDLDAEARRLGIRIGGLSFDLALIDPDSIREEPDIPELDWPATYVITGRQFGRAVTAADLCSDHVEMAGDDGELVVSARGDTDDVELTLTDELLSSRFDGNGDGVTSLFSLDYLDDMSGPVGSDTEVSVVLGDELPVKFRYSDHDGGVQVLNLLAPRIQSEGGA